MTIALKF